MPVTDRFASRLTQLVYMTLCLSLSVAACLSLSVFCLSVRISLPRAGSELYCFPASQGIREDLLNGHYFYLKNICKQPHDLPRRAKDSRSFVEHTHVHTHIRTYQHMRPSSTEQQHISGLQLVCQNVICNCFYQTSPPPPPTGQRVPVVVYVFEEKSP